MGFVKILKNKAYYKRFQTKFRRRREGKTDFYARKRLVVQDKNKYNSPKYRFVVRMTNKDIICQVVYTKVIGDFVLCAAYSHELPKFGVKVGLTNYSAAYATGLLCARRLLQKLGMDKDFAGKVEADGEYYSIVDDYEAERRPFQCFLDVGLARTTTGARLFAAMKGAADGGLNVPHNTKRFVGYNSENKALDVDSFRGHLFGQHVAAYMRQLKDEEPEKFARQFCGYIKAGVDADGLEAMYKKAHVAIRASPELKKSEKKVAHYKIQRKTKLTLSQRKAKTAQKIASVLREA